MITRPADAPRDYSTISPSALSLLLIKSGTSIAFAKEAAALLWNGSVPDELAQAMTEENARRRLRHFEKRYRSLDRLLSQANCPNVLEIGSGLSFRGLELARTNAVHYVDTDLPELAELKAGLVARLHPEPLVGTLRVQPLNALDSEAFRSTVASMPDGPLAIANEGLLVYLDAREKAELAANVRAALIARGGRWLTADVYLKNPGGSAPTVGYGRLRAFIDAHRVEQNKFDNWTDAERFFDEAGFEIVERLADPHPMHIRESWALAARS